MEQNDKKEAEPQKEQEEQAEAKEESELEELLEENEKEEEKTETPEELAEAKPTEEPAPVEEEEKVEAPAREREPEKEEEIVEERIYTIPLGRAHVRPQRKRTPRAMSILKSFLIKHMKLETRKTAEIEEEEEPKKLIISNEVNEKIWGKGVEKPPRKIRVRAAKDKEGNVTVYLAEGD